MTAVAAPMAFVSAAVGMLFVAVGLYLFDEGLEVGLFPLGDEMTRGLMRHGVTLWVLYLYGCLLYTSRCV